MLVIFGYYGNDEEVLFISECLDYDLLKELSVFGTVDTQAIHKNEHGGQERSLSDLVLQKRIAQELHNSCPEKLRRLKKVF